MHYLIIRHNKLKHHHDHAVCALLRYGLTCDSVASSSSFITEGLERCDLLAIIRAVRPSCDDDHMKG